MVHKLNFGSKFKVETNIVEYLHPYKVLEKFGLKKGDYVADVGCGRGFFSFAACDIVGDRGRVFAIDKSNNAIELMENKIYEENISNIRPIISKENDLVLDNENVEFTFLCSVLNEVGEPSTILNEISRITKENGSVAIVEWKKEESEIGPSINDRIEVMKLKELVLEAGFKRIEEIELGNHFYGLKAIK